MTRKNSSTSWRKADNVASRPWTGSVREYDLVKELTIGVVVVGLLVLMTREVWTAPSWAALPASLSVTPRGWGWALAVIPPHPVPAHAAQLILLVGAVFGTAGCFSRLSFAGVTLAALYCLALPLRNGLPYHYQHLVWFAALCAASPCGDALSIDSWRRRRASKARLSGHASLRNACSSSVVGSTPSRDPDISSTWTGSATTTPRHERAARE